MKQQTLVDIFKDLGQITCATLVIESVIKSNPDVLIIIFGLVVSIYFWWLSLLLSK